MPEFVSSVDECGTFRDTGVVDENIRVAETLAHLAEHPRDAFRIGDIAHEGNRAVADLTSDLFDLFGRARRDCDTHTLACKRERYCASYASAAAGY